MNIPEIKSAVKYLQKNCPCANCKTKYKQKNMHLIASTKQEALFEMRCEQCHSSSIMSLILDGEFNEEMPQHRPHKTISQSISKNDILDMKNFLNHFDGNFKRIFKIP